jgi:ABC-type multidrug transport system ATPase subunit
MDEAAMCDELLIMHNGKVLKTGTPNRLVGDYPYDLYKVASENKTVTCSNKITLPSYVIQMYPSGGAVHVAIPKDLLPDEQMKNQLLALIEDAKTVKKVQPDIEDLFFLLIADNGNQKVNTKSEKAQIL